MKGSRNSNSKQNKQGYTHVPKPDIRDDMDSRKTHELHYKDKNNKQGIKPNKKK